MSVKGRIGHIYAIRRRIGHIYRIGGGLGSEGEVGDKEQR